MLQFFTIMLMLDAQKISLLCSKGVTILLHYAHIKKLIYTFKSPKKSINACYIGAWATPQCNPPLLWLGYYEMSFLVMKKLALMQQKRVELAKPSCMLQPNLEAQISLGLSRAQTTTATPPASFREFRHYYSGIMLNAFASLLCSK